MVSIEDVVAQLHKVLGHVDRMIASLQVAVDRAEDAAGLISTAGRGSAHEADFEQVAGAFAETQASGADLIRMSDVVKRQIDRMIAALRGTGPPAAPSDPTAPGRVPQSWAAQQRAKLPAHITSGIYVDEDGNTEVVQSGRETDGEHERINDHFVTQGIVGPKGTVESTKHVEIKVAWRMRTGGSGDVHLAVNNEVCRGVLSCAMLLPFVLRPGQTLTVHDPVRSTAFRGRDD